MSQNSARAVGIHPVAKRTVINSGVLGFEVSGIRGRSKLILIVASLLISAGCFDQSTRVPEAPVAAGGVTSCSGQHSVFVPTGEMIGSRADHTATLLSDGRVLFAGGYLSSYFVEHAVVDTSEVYEPSAHTFHETGKMTSARSEASATRLPDGRVLITGGFDQGRFVGLGSIARVPVKTTEIFDPKSDVFTASSPMLSPRYAHSSMLLKNGKVLIAGGSCQAENFMGVAQGGACGPELFDPDKGIFSMADASDAPHNEEDAIVLVDGNVLLFCAGTAAELYDSKSGQFTRTGSLSERLDSCVGTLLQDGRVLLFGNTRIGNVTREPPHWQAEIYDPKIGSFSKLGNPPLEINDPATATIESDRVLVSGEVNPDYYNILSSEVFDSSRNEFSVLGAQHPHRIGFTATTLTDGSVLIAGGSSVSLPYNVQRAVLFCP